MSLLIDFRVEDEWLDWVISTQTLMRSFTLVELAEVEWAVLKWSAVTSDCVGSSSIQGHNDLKLLRPRAGGIVPDVEAVVGAAAADGAGAASRQYKAEADTADSRRRKAEAATTFPQV